MKKGIVALLLLVILAAGAFFYFNRPKTGINSIQVIGSHNSYKEYIDTPLFQLIKREDSNAVKGIEYTHMSLADQLTLGLRSLEIDVYADSKGGKYAHPAGLTWAGTNPARPYDPKGLMNEPGFKVLHMQDIDFRSNCLTLKNCLNELKTWSDAHPDHEPIFITMNAKDDTMNRPGFVIPERFTSATLNELDNMISNNLGHKKLITPDMVKGNYETLEKAVLAGNWPKIDEAKGRFIFVLDEEGDKRQMYIQDHPSLKSRVLFVNAPEGTPESAIIILNDPVKSLLQIQELVKKGYIVRTRADADTREARSNDTSRFMAACKSGAQIISTDYYAKSSLFTSNYKISFDGGKYVRENPVVK
ncbi:MAG: phosphatidylinositol-specific phospholipase C1-like protein [Ferruginibacter sp.]